MRLTASALIGRDGERELVVEIVERAGTGRGSTVGVVGEAGLGKSRLVNEVVRRASELGCTVAVGRATPGLPIPFRPITEALLMLERERGVRTDGSAPDWLRFLDRVVPGWGGGERAGEATIPVIGASMVRCFEAVRTGGPVVLVVEDLHWADDETLSLIEFLADNVSASHVAVVATMRPEPGDAHRMFQRLERRGSAAVVELRPLRPAEVAALVRDCLGGGVMPDVERFVDERCDGNPLFAEELLAGLQSSGSLAYDVEGWRVVTGITTGVPATLAEAVRDRFAALAVEDRTVVGAAAVLGRRFAWRTVQAMTGVSGDHVLAALRRAEDVQLVQFRDDRHQFRHALTCDVIRGLVPDSDRRALAARALDRLADRTDLVLVASLAEQAGDHVVALAHLRAVAAQHVATGALASATSVLRRAELLALEPVDRIDVAIELASALLLAGDGEGARLACDAVTAWATDVRIDLERRVKLRVLLAQASILVGDWVRADDDVAVAASMTTSSAALRAEVEAAAAHVCLNLGRHDDAVLHAEAAIDGALSASRPEIACEALEAIGRSMRFRDPVASSLAFARAIDIATDAGLAATRLRALHETAVNDAFLEWRFDRLAVVRRDAEAMGAVLTLAVVDLHDAGSLLVGGEIDDARPATMRCLDACRRYRLSMLPIVLVHHGVVAAFSGDGDGAGAAVDEALRLAPDDLDVRSQAAGWVDASRSLVAGDLDEWWARLDLGMSIVGDSNATIPSPWRGQWALAAAVRGDDVPAERLRASHASVVAPNRAYLAMIDAVRLARAGRLADADRGFASAVDLLTGPRTDLLRHLGCVLVAPVAVELGWGDPATWLRSADAWSADAGLHGLTSTIRSTMRRLDVPVPRRGRGENVVPPVLRRLGVTSREMDVLVLLVDRSSNREIADRLHLSVRTVEKHVASLLSKTASRDRHALAMLVADPV